MTCRAKCFKLVFRMLARKTPNPYEVAEPVENISMDNGARAKLKSAMKKNMKIK